MAHDQESILAGIISKLLTAGVGTFAEAVGNRVYRTIAPPDTSLPCAVVSVVDDPPDRYFGQADAFMTVNIAVIGARDASETTLQAILTKLFTYDAAVLTVSGQGGASMWVENRGIPTEDRYRIQLTTLWGVAATTE